MTKFHRLICSFIAVLAFTLAPLRGASLTSSANEKLLAALEPLEGLTEAGLGGNAGKIKKALKAAEADRDSTRTLLAPGAATRFDATFTEVTSAQKKNDHLALSLAAAELYKLVAESLDPATLKIPREVSLLDYVGFRTKALLAAAKPDWKAIADTAREANGDWQKIRERVGDKKLQTAMDQAQHDLTVAAEKNDPVLSGKATRQDLDLVDELENYFSK